MTPKHSIRTLCQTFGVSPSGYYGWKARQNCPSLRCRQDEELQKQIAQIHQSSRQTYGVPRIQICLRESGGRHGRNRIGRLMRAQNLFGRQRRRFRPRTTESRHGQPIAPNRLLAAQVRGPNEVWVGDITYIATGEGWLYLAAILDLYSRRIVGWAMGPRLDTALVLRAWEMACTHRAPRAAWLFHSDRGVQYASQAFRQALALAGAVPSMSRQANCYDNAVMESFWSTLKWELVYRRAWATQEQARPELFDYIESFYNRQRLHSSLGYQSPAQFEMTRN